MQTLSTETGPIGRGSGARHFQRVRAYALAATTCSTDCFAGASTIRSRSAYCINDLSRFLQLPLWLCGRQPLLWGHFRVLVIRSDTMDKNESIDPGTRPCRAGSPWVPPCLRESWSNRLIALAAAINNTRVQSLGNPCTIGFFYASSAAGAVSTSAATGGRVFPAIFDRLVELALQYHTAPRPKMLRLLASFWITGCIFAAQPTSLAQSPSWSQEVLPDLSRMSPGLPASLLDGSRAGAAFLNTGQLMIYTVEPTGHLSSRRSPEISSAFQLRLSLLDAKSGEIALTKDWGTRRHDSAVQITSGGVLVQTGGIVKLYSTDFTQSRDLPLALDPNGSYFTSVSASGKTIAISHYFKNERKWISHIDVLDASSLKIRASWDQDPPIFYLSMSDQRFITTDPFHNIVFLTKFGNTSQSKAVPNVGALRQGCPAGGIGATMVSGESIVLRGCKDVFLLNPSGVSSALHAFADNASAGPASSQCGTYIPSMFNKMAKVASGAPFVALSLPAIKIKKHLLTEPSVCLTGLQVAVYDLSRKQRVFTVNVDPLPKNDYDFGLSPDGSKLAILNDRNISVYSVPVPASNDGAAH
jgi:hypothetical protein